MSAPTVEQNDQHPRPEKPETETQPETVAQPEPETPPKPDVQAEGATEASEAQSAIESQTAPQTPAEGPTSPDAATGSEATAETVADGEPAPSPGGEPQAKAGPKRKQKGGTKPDRKPGGKSTPKVPPGDIVQRIGDTAEQALRYVLAPDPQLSRLSRKVREQLIADLPAVTAGALLGPAALARHFVASAAHGRYRDLFSLWELFRQRPEECKPILAERQQALEKARRALETALRLGLQGRAERVAEDVAAAQGLIWQWTREFLGGHLDEAAERPAIAAALLRREPELSLPMPTEPGETWLAEAAAVPNPPPPIADLLSQHADKLPPTIANLTLATERYPAAVPRLLERVDLDSPDADRVLAWARDHGHLELLQRRLQDRLGAAGDRAEVLRLWHTWTERGLELPLPETLRNPEIDGLDFGRPETAVLLARWLAEGADINVQATLDDLAGRNRQLAEKAYEAFVCADLDVRLPIALEGNPIVREGTRCPACSAWTWVRPGHERRCPRRARAAEPDPVTTS